MPGIKELKTRIKSIGSMRKITRAMQMVSAAKMRKAQNATLSSRGYSNLAWELIENLAANVDYSNPLMANYPEAKKVGVILLSSNMGLVGSLNSNLMPKVREINGGETIAELVTYGKHAKSIAVKLNKTIAADFTKVDRTITTEDVYPLAQFITKAYSSGQYKKIVIIYNLFVSTLAQKPTVRQLLPFKENSGSSRAGQTWDEADAQTDTENSPYLFEPNPKEVLNHLLPRIIESQIYQAILESDASEQSARMVMMKNATEAAGDLISDLTLTFNQLRQNKITTELAEITAGKIALE